MLFFAGRARGGWGGGIFPQEQQVVLPRGSTAAGRGALARQCPAMVPRDSRGLILFSGFVFGAEFVLDFLHEFIVDCAGFVALFQCSDG